MESSCPSYYLWFRFWWIQIREDKVTTLSHMYFLADSRQFHISSFYYEGNIVRGNLIKFWKAPDQVSISSTVYKQLLHPQIQKPQIWRKLKATKLT